jgi:hypothetical protein
LMGACADFVVCVTLEMYAACLCRLLQARALVTITAAVSSPEQRRYPLRRFTVHKPGK